MSKLLPGAGHAPKRKMDHFLWGLGLGLGLPFVGIYIYFISTYSVVMDFAFFLEYISTTVRTIVPLVSLSCVLNLGLFFIFYFLHKNRSAQGVIMATMIYAGWVVYMKVFA
jgi:hypothetical protein